MRWIVATLLACLGGSALAQTLPLPSYRGVILSPQAGTPAGVVNGQCWTQSTGLFCYVAGGVVGPYVPGSGFVSTTGTPASGNLTKFSGAASITNGDLTGDVTTSGTLGTTLATVNANTGSWGDGTHVGQITVNAKGLITAAASVAISGAPPTGSAGGDLSGTYPSPAVAKINGATLGTTTATSGNLLIGSGSSWVTQAMTGDATITLGGVTVVSKLNGVAYGTSPSTNTVPVVTSADTVTYEAVPNAALANSSITIGGQATSLGGSTTNQGNGAKLQLSTGTTTASHCVQYDADGNTVDAGFACGSGAGSVGTTGTPATGNLTTFSGASTITNSDLTGDVTTSGTVATTLATVNANVGTFGDASHVAAITLNAKGQATAASSIAISVPPSGSASGDLSGTYPGPTVAKVNGVTYGSSPSTNTVPVVTGAGTVTYEAVPNAALLNSTIGVNGQTCTLGSTCTVTAAASGVTVGTTTIGSGTTGRVLYDNAGVLGELVSGDGVAVSGGNIQADHTSTATTASATLTLTPANGTSGIKVTLNQSVTITVSNGTYDGQHLRVKLQQDGTGGWTVAFDASVHFGTDIPSFTATTTASQASYVQLVYDATNTRWDLLAVNHGF